MSYWVPGMIARSVVRLFRLLRNRRKIDLAKIHESVNTVCPKCKKTITPAEIQRVDFRSRQVSGVRRAVRAERTLVAAAL